MLKVGDAIRARGESWTVVQDERDGKVVAKTLKDGRLSKLMLTEVEATSNKPRPSMAGVNILNDAKYFEKNDIVHFQKPGNAKPTDAVVLWTHYGKVIVRVTETEATVRLDPAEVIIKMGRAPVEFTGFSRKNGGGLRAAINEMPASPWTSK